MISPTRSGYLLFAKFALGSLFVSLATHCTTGNQPLVDVADVEVSDGPRFTDADAMGLRLDAMDVSDVSAIDATMETNDVIDDAADAEAVDVPEMDVAAMDVRDADVVDVIDARADVDVPTVDVPPPNVVFVSVTTGNDANGGRTSNVPVRTLARGLTIAQLCNCEVRVANGVYNTGLTITNAVTMRGGYSPVDWSRPGVMGAPTTIITTAAEGPALTVSVPVAGRTVTLDRFSIIGGPARAVDRTAIAVLATNPVRLEIVNSRIQSMDGLAGDPGSNSGFAACMGNGGAGGTSSCDQAAATGANGGSVAGSNGGSGGAGGRRSDCHGGVACPGLNRDGTDSGSAGGNVTTLQNSVSAGPVSMNILGSFDQMLLRFTPNTAPNGNDGLQGPGGGGGGAGGTKTANSCLGCGFNLAGGSGGTGGAGGCGGAGGGGGIQGGASIGIVALRSTLDLTGSTIVTGRGGAGGRGGDGGTGENGHIGANGGGSSSHDCGARTYESNVGGNGGVGGGGSGGSGGAGGSGGPSVGVALVNGGAIATMPMFTLGAGGSGGSGGNGGARSGNIVMPALPRVTSDSGPTGRTGASVTVNNY